MIKVFLRHNASGRRVHATLSDLTQRHLRLWRKQWKPCFDKMKKLGEKRYPEAFWDWFEIFQTALSLTGSRGFVIVHRNQLEGLVVVRFENARGYANKSLVRVEYLMTAPWNRPDNLFTPQGKAEFSWAGTWLLYHVCQFSMKLGYEGRIGLSSEPGAEKYYQERIGMEPMGKNAEGEPYFELDEDGAINFMADFEETIQEMTNP